jgi:hypothetical protein
VCVGQRNGRDPDPHRQAGGDAGLIQEVASLPDPANIGREALDPRKPHSLSVTAPSGVIYFAIKQKNVAKQI